MGSLIYLSQNMDEQENISFEKMFREYEAKRLNRKKSSNINKDNISPFVKEAIEEFRKLADQIIEEINNRKNECTIRYGCN
jgi:histone H3/H4